MTLRKLTLNGIGQFTAYLANLKDDPKLSPPKHLLIEEDASEPAAALEVQDRSFRTRLEIAKYLNALVSSAAIPDVERDAGLWTWLTLFYFDQLCPPNQHGLRKPGEQAVCATK